MTSDDMVTDHWSFSRMPKHCHAHIKSFIFVGCYEVGLHVKIDRLRAPLLTRRCEAVSAVYLVLNISAGAQISNT